MNFFNSQNFSRFGRWKTVYLNMVNELGQFNFRSIDDSGNTPVAVNCTAKDFLRAKTRKLCYNYLGQIHECNYSEQVQVLGGGARKFTYHLNKVSITTSTFTTYLVWDFAKAIFINGVPIMSITLIIQGSNIVSQSFINATQEGYNSYLVVTSSSDDTPDPPTFDLPLFRTPGAPDIQFPVGLLEGWQGQYPAFGHIQRTDSGPGGITTPTILAWCPQNKEDYIVITAIYKNPEVDYFSFNPQAPIISDPEGLSIFSDEPDAIFEGIHNLNAYPSSGEDIPEA